jgi:tetratricopeptide (TPR) repeat protein
MQPERDWQEALTRADTLLRDGESTDNVGTIAEAVSAFHAALKLTSRGSMDWAWTQCRLSAALRALAARGGDAMLPQAAISAAEAALGVYTFDATPLDWARANALLGTAQAVAGERAADPDWLEAAISSYAAAMTVYTRAAAPLDWARMQRNTGAVLSLLGEHGKSQAPLMQATTCYRAALEEYRDGPDHAMTQSNLGHALRLLGERLNDAVLLQEAIDACRAALAIYTCAAAPRDWAMTSTNLANALAAHGDLEDAITVYRAVADAAQDPAQRSVARYNLALAERRLRSTPSPL